MCGVKKYVERNKRLKTLPPLLATAISNIYSSENEHTASSNEQRTTEQSRAEQNRTDYEKRKKKQWNLIVRSNPINNRTHRSTRIFLP